MRPIVRRWLALITASISLYLVLPDRGLAQNNQGQNNQGNLPIVGSWILHITVTTFNENVLTPPLKFDNLQSFWENGITVTSDDIVGTGYGVWKRSGPPRTYEFKFLFIFPPGLAEPEGTIRTVLDGPVMLNHQGTEMTGSFHGFDTAPGGTVPIATFSGTVVYDRISFTSSP